MTDTPLQQSLKGFPFDLIQDLVVDLGFKKGGERKKKSKEKKMYWSI